MNPASAARQASRPLCRDCADFGPICPNSGRPCGGTDAAPRAEQRAGQAPAEDERAEFEAWAIKEGYPTNFTLDAECGVEGGGVYADSRTHAAWWAYRAGRATQPQPKGTPAGYVTAIDEGKALMLPRPSLDTTGLVAVYTAAQATAPAPDGLTGEQLDGIRQALLDTAKDPHDIDEADRIVERILSSFKPATQAPAVRDRDV